MARRYPIHTLCSAFNLAWASPLQASIISCPFEPFCRRYASRPRRIDPLCGDRALPLHLHPLAHGRGAESAVHALCHQPGNCRSNRHVLRRTAVEAAFAGAFRFGLSYIRKKRAVVACVQRGSTCATFLLTSPQRTVLSRGQSNVTCRCIFCVRPSMTPIGGSRPLIRGARSRMLPAWTPPAADMVCQFSQRLRAAESFWRRFRKGVASPAGCWTLAEERSAKRKPSIPTTTLGGLTTEFSGQRASSSLIDMWKAETLKNEVFDFSDIVPDEILLEFDGPQIYTFKKGNLLFLAYTSAISDDNVKKLLVTAIKPETLKKVQTGELPIFSALDNPLVWEVLQDSDDITISSAVLSDGMRSIPREYLPMPHATIGSKKKQPKPTQSFGSSISVESEAYQVAAMILEQSSLKVRRIGSFTSWSESSNRVTLNSVQGQLPRYQERSAATTNIRRRGLR